MSIPQGSQADNRWSFKRVGPGVGKLRVGKSFFAAIKRPSPKNQTCCRRPRETQTLLDAFVLEKALYELLYELNNRPAWIHIPIAGILSLCI